MRNAATRWTVGWLGRAGTEAEERRGQHHPAEARPAGARRAQANERARRMGETEMRRRTVGQRHLLHERIEVAVVFVETVDMALARIAQPPLGAALPAPVERRDGQTAFPEVADQLEIFLDAFAAAGKDADRAERPPPGRPASGRSAAARRRSPESNR